MGLQLPWGAALSWGAAFSQTWAGKVMGFGTLTPQLRHESLDEAEFCEWFGGSVQCAIGNRQREGNGKPFMKGSVRVQCWPLKCHRHLIFGSLG